MLSSKAHMGLPPLPPMAPPPRRLLPREALQRAEGSSAASTDTSMATVLGGEVVADTFGKVGGVSAEAVETLPLPTFPPRFCASSSAPARGGDNSEGPSESSNPGGPISEDTEDDFMATIPHLERFYEQLAAKAKLPERNGAGAQSWVLSLARSYRRLSRDKRRRGGLRAHLGLGAGLSQATGSAGLGGGLREQCGFSSNTDDSGYEAGYETDADESELSEWESGTASQRQQRHKRKLEALVNLTMNLSVSGSQKMKEEEMALDGLRPPPFKHRALGTQPVGMRFALPRSPLATPIESGAGVESEREEEVMELG